jgi:hypothetical protein
MTCNPYPLAKELARPVARGYLTLTEAHAELLLAACKAVRDGYQDQDAAGIWRLQRHVLGLYLEAEERRRDLAEARVKRRLRPLIALRKPPNVLLAEAHGVNGAEGFPLEEPEVNSIAVAEMHWARPRLEGPRHAR